MEHSIKISKEQIYFNTINPKAETVGITVNGNENSSCYDLMYDSTWLKVQKYKGYIEIIPSENNTNNYNRIDTIVVFNNTDRNIYAILTVIQKHTEFKIEIKKDGKTLDNISISQFNDTDNDKKEITLNVLVYGGNKKFYIADISEYLTDSDTQFVYDNSIEIINKNSTIHEDEDYCDYEIQILTFGNLISENYYTNINFMHFDNAMIYSDENTEKDITENEDEIKFVGTIFRIDFDVLPNMDNILLNNSEKIYCDKEYEVFKNIPDSSFSDAKMKYIDEYLYIMHNDDKNPNVIDMSVNPENILIYSCINKNGEENFSSEMYASVSSSNFRISISDYDETKKCREANISYIGESTKLAHSCKVTLYNMDDINQNISFIVRHKS